MKNVYLLYEADRWLSYSSLVLFGEFTTKKKLYKAVRKLALDQFRRGVVIDEYEEGKRAFISGICYEVERNGQYLGHDAGIYVKEVRLNVFEEV